jgi:hypothetical protein
MDLRYGSPRQRAAQYVEQAASLRQSAEAEPVQEIRQILLAAAEQYQKIAESLLQLS